MKKLNQHSLKVIRHALTDYAVHLRELYPEMPEGVGKELVKLEQEDIASTLEIITDLEYGMQKRIIIER